MLWGFKLEIKQSLRSKKLIAVLAIMILLYIPFFYIMKKSGDIGATEIMDVMSMLIQFLGGMATFFIAILALLMGVTAINSEIEKGTLRVAMSKPISRLGYIGGKMLAQIATLFLALLFSTVVALIGFQYIGVSVDGLVIREVFLLNMLLLLALTQLLLLGYLISTLIKSSSTALGLGLVLFFVMTLVVPSIVNYIAFTHSDHGENIETIQKDYSTKYLFFEPTTQLKLLLSNISEPECYNVTKVVYQNHTREPKTLNRTRVDKSYCEGELTFKETPGDNGSIIISTYEVSPRYAGIVHSVKGNMRNFYILLGMMVVYAALAVFRFLRMDLR